MARTRAWLGALSLALVVSASLNAYLLLKPSPRQATHEAPTPDASIPRASKPTKTAARQTRFVPPSKRPKLTATKERGKNTHPRHRFKEESADTPEARARQTAVSAHVEILFPDEPRPRVTCKTNCCQVEAVGWRGLTSVIQSSSGFSGWANGVGFSRRDDKTVATMCFDPTKQGPPHPIRAKEYAKTRKTALPALQKCARLADESVHLILGLVIAKDGAVQRANMDGGYSQYKAARCAEKTIMTIAKFSAASDRTFLRFPIFLDAEKRTAR